MSVPLDRLYNHLDGLCNHDTIIYRFSPHGSRNLQDIVPLIDSRRINRVDLALKPIMLCYDQEPIMAYNWAHECVRYFDSQVPDHMADPESKKIIMAWINQLGLRSIFANRNNVWDKMLIVHSEKNSVQLQEFCNQNFVPVYWWSHAAIAADWYRYAELDPVLNSVNKPQIDFLIYNRAWSNSREYRLKFCELLLNHELTQSSLIKFNPIDQDCHYKNHKFINSNLQITRYDFEQHFAQNNHGPESSADYCTEDYAKSGIEVVLETLFDDSRIQLTEKSLRPIACGKPFILVSTLHSLKYIRQYGFETFGELINESYDDVIDPAERLECIIQEMKRISAMPKDEKQQLWYNLNCIAERNRQRFFSSQWLKKIFTEFKENYCQAREQLSATNSHRSWIRSLEPHPFSNKADGLGCIETANQIVDSWLSNRLSQHG